MLTPADTQLIDDLYQIHSLKFGEFKIKSGAISPFYVDLRVIISRPGVLRQVADRLLPLVTPLAGQHVAGIPYAGLPIATAVSLAGNIPLLYARKEAKDYGTRRLIEGKYAPGEVVIMIDDVISDGASKFEAAAPFEEAGLKIRDFVILLDREQGGADRLRERGYALHSALKITDVLAYLREKGHLDPALHQRCLDFIATTRP